MLPDIPLPPPHVQVPVTMECLSQAAKRFRLPEEVLVTVLAVEGGRVGQASRNRNGTHDLGPMQVNTVWLREMTRLRRAGALPVLLRDDRVLSEGYHYLKNNGCLNVYVGAWILKMAVRRSGDDLAAGVAAYHSATPRHRAVYLKRVIAKLTRIRKVGVRTYARRLLAKINAGIDRKKR